MMACFSSLLTRNKRSRVDGYSLTKHCFSSLLTRNKRSRVDGYSLTKHSESAHEYSVNDRDR